METLLLKNMQMKKVLVCLLVMMMSLHLFAQENAISEIKKVLQMQEKAWNRGDIQAFMNGYWKNDSLLFVGKAGPVYGWQGALDRYIKTYPDKETMGILTFNLLRFDGLSASSYFVLGKWHLKRKKGDVGGVFTLVFKKIDGKWLIVADHTS